MNRLILAPVLALVLASCALTDTKPVNDALPGSPPPATSSPDANPTPAPAPTVETLRSGSFYTVAPNHDTSGTAKLLRLEDGTLTLRLEGFKTVAGPDVRVWLSSAAAPKDSGSVGSGAYLDLGGVKSTSGNQNYAIPVGTNLGAYKSVVIWCRAFSVNFGSAALE